MTGPLRRPLELALPQRMYTTPSTATSPEPTYTSSYCSASTATMWTGIGGSLPVRLLPKAGTIIGTYTQGLPQGQFWEQMLPAQPNLVPLAGLVASTGDALAFNIHHGGTNNNQYAFALYDFTSGIIYPFTATTSGYDGTTAEFVTERPETSPGPPPVFTQLSAFTNFNWTGGTSVNGSTIASFTHAPIYMYASNPPPTGEMAQPSGLNGSTGGFTQGYLTCDGTHT